MIEYFFEIDNGDTLHFEIDLNRKYDENKGSAEHHEWTKLNYHQCDHCPLTEKTFRYCPPAFDLQEIIQNCSSLISHEKATVRVKTQEREYKKKCDIQTGIQSVLGLVMATSACPLLSRLKPVANFHLPFGTTEDTLFRSVGAYLIQQYFIYSDGGEPDFKLENLQGFYNNLEKLNTFFSERIRAASRSDANLGAIVQLGALSFMVKASLQDQLKTFRKTFEGKYTEY